MYTVTFSKTGRREFKSEMFYSQKNWGVQHAKRYKEDLLNKLKILETNPKIFQTRPELGDDIRILKFKGNNIIYKILEDKKQAVILSVSSIYKDLPETLH